MSEITKLCASVIIQERVYVSLQWGKYEALSFAVFLPIFSTNLIAIKENKEEAEQRSLSEYCPQSLLFKQANFYQFA
jgi:hypothetical protein